MIKLTATDLDGWERLLSACRELLPKGQWWGFWPTAARPWAHNERQTPIVYVRRELLPVMVAEMAVQLPESYFQLVACWLKRTMWEEWFPHERRPTDGSASKFWIAKERGRLVELKKSGEWIADPDWYEPTVDCELEILIPGVKMIHDRIENFDLGQRLPVNPADSANGSADRDPKTDSGIPENLREYYSLPENQRAEYLQRKPWLAAMLNTP